MDPLSITASVITLVGFGKETQSLLKSTYKDLKYARRQIEDLSSDVKFTNGLFNNLAALLDRSPESLSDTFVEQARYLVNKSHELFEAINEDCLLDRKEIDRLRSIDRAKWLTNKSDLITKQKKLKEVQMDFLFLHTSLLYQGSSAPAAPPPPRPMPHPPRNPSPSDGPMGTKGIDGGSDAGASSNTLDALYDIPLQLSTGPDAPVQLLATLSLQPSAPSTLSPPPVRSRPLTPRAKEAEERKQRNEARGYEYEIAHRKTTREEDARTEKESRLKADVDKERRRKMEEQKEMKKRAEMENLEGGKKKKTHGIESRTFMDTEPVVEDPPVDHRQRLLEQMEELRGSVDYNML